MKYLKKEIFYPAEESEENDKLQDEQIAAYWEYLDKIRRNFQRSYLTLMTGRIISMTTP